jgi:hypothetical protein
VDLYDQKPTRANERVDLRRINKESDTHAMPQFKPGERRHSDDIDCWCSPVITFADALSGRRVVTHIGVPKP